MKIVKSTKNEVPVWDVRLGYDELLALSNLVQQAHQDAPKLFETMPARARIRGMHKDLGNALREYKESNLNQHE